MRLHTAVLRVLLVTALAGALIACGLLYLVSLETVASWPELAGWRLPVYLGIVAGLLPAVAVVVSGFRFLALVDLGEAFSDRTVQLLRRMRMLLVVVAAWFAVGFVGFWAGTGLMHVTLVLIWCAVEVGALLGIGLLALFEGLFAGAARLRRDAGLVSAGGAGTIRAPDPHIPFP